ncbi:hypothetical protein BDR03DRAFT_91016 [Suillus americanus]|nr:hypothetical protein BDR03DRAFT_91016 [Suillus americanus]
MLMSSTREKMTIPINAIDQLITASQSDIRQYLNMLLTRQLSNSSTDLNVKFACTYSMISTRHMSQKKMTQKVHNFITSKSYTTSSCHGTNLRWSTGSMDMEYLKNHPERRN